MKLLTKIKKITAWKLLLLFIGFNTTLKADIITDWNVKARNLVVASKQYTPFANRSMAIIHTSIYEAVKTISNDPNYTNESLDSAVAAASYTSLIGLFPKQQVSIEKIYNEALNVITNGNAKSQGIKIGTQCAKSILAMRADDGYNQMESYRPSTNIGKYVPTVIPAVPHWPQRKTWMLDNPKQFRPGPPPSITSKKWAKDFNEVKSYGGVNSIKRTQEQTNIARFWEATLPPIYHGVVHSVADQSGRSVLQNARLFALITQATDDAMIAVFDAKYHFALWRPVTAIRNADRDANKRTKRDASWKPFIPTPMHPEYPCAHCVVAGTVGAVLKAEVGDSKMPLLTTSSITADGKTRSWTTIEDFIQEVTDARIYDGVHYRNSGDVGSAMGKKIGKLAVKAYENN